MSKYECTIANEIYTEQYGWIFKNEVIIVEAMNKPEAYWKAREHGDVLCVVKK